MEVAFLFFSILLTFLLFLFMFLKIVKSSSQTNCNENPNLPPGPRKLPFIGNLHQLVGSLLHHRLRDLAKKYGPFMHLQLGEVSTVVVSSAEFAKEIMKTHDIIFASRPPNLAARIVSYNYSDVIFSSYGEYWRQVRKICILELLSMKKVQSFRSVREEEISNLINLINSKAGSEINITDKVMSLASTVLARAAFGEKCVDQESFLSIVNDVMKLFAGFSVADLFPSIQLLPLISGIKSQINKLHQEFDRICGNIINEHKKRKPSEGDGDLVDVLLRLQGESNLQFPLSTDNIKALIFDMFLGGTDTSSITVDWAMSELIKNPRLMRRAQAEVREVFNRKGKVDETALNDMKFLKLVIKETLRLHPPAPLLVARESRERCEINGFNIPVKTNVIVNAWAIGRDSKYWNEPESFKPERFIDSSVDYKGSNFEFLPFGAGRRICPGLSFGIANVELLLAKLLYHFDWKLPNGMKHEDLDLTESFALTVRRKDDLLLIPSPYSPSHVA